MTLIARNHVTEKIQTRAFSPPPERQGASFLTIALMFAALFYVLFHLSQWALEQRAPAPRHWALKPQPASELKGAAPQAPAFAPLPAQQDARDPRNSTRTITKCVVNGKISYNDYGCAAGAVATSVVTRPSQNQTAAVRPGANPAVQPKEPGRSPSVVAQASNVPAARAAECRSIDAQVTSLDVMARQPQSGQMQDWIRAERKRLRDSQFQIPCR
jgi:hypothetical protein